MEASVLDKNSTTVNQQGIWLRPPAKINLSLVVFPPRPDGYHDLHSIIAKVSLFDDLALSSTSTVGIDLRCSGHPCPSAKDNLVYQAAQMLADYADIVPAVQIRLHKRIPSGAGLGGASSDAASCLMGLNQLWDLHLPRQQLCQLAGQLGSDVPFFLYGPVSLCTGRGEFVQSLPHRCRRSILLVIPELSAPTAQVYQNYQHDIGRSEDQMRRVNYFLRGGDLDGLVIQRINSLETSCMELYPPLAELRQSIEKLGVGPLQISGSGSCLFATYETKTEAARGAGLIQQHNLVQVQALSFAEQLEPFLEVHHADF